jgi:hypothetical protein
VAETCFFRLTWGLISGRVGLATDRLSPVSTGITARHWRALLFLGCLSPRIENARREDRAARRECGIPFRFVSSQIFARSHGPFPSTLQRTPPVSAGSTRPGATGSSTPRQRHRQSGASTKRRMAKNSAMRVIGAGLDALGPAGPVAHRFLRGGPIFPSLVHGV